MLTNIDAKKKTFRQQAKAKRLAAYNQHPQAGQSIAETLLAQAFPVTSKISAFWPLSEELDTLPLLHALHAQGHQLLLPIMQGAGKPLLFGLWQPGDQLVKASFQTLEPHADKPRMIPDIMLCPLLAFDRQGYRMGYGGGFYDRTIAQLKSQAPLTTIGIAFAEQEVPAVITGAYDEPLHRIITQNEVIEISASPQQAK